MSETQGTGARSGGRFTKGQSGNPAGRPKRERRDGWINTASGHGTSRDRRTLTRFGLDIVTDLEALQMWRSEWLCAKVIETRPREAFRRGYDVDLDDKTKSEKLVALIEELGVDNMFVRALEYERAFGGAAIFPVLDGALGDLTEPLDLGSIAAVKAFHVLEPRELQVVSWYEDILDPKFGKPMIYRLTPIAAGRSGSWSQQEIHESRLVVFPGIRVSKQTQPGQREGWGDSELSRPRQLIQDLGLSLGSATTILQNYGRDVLQLEGWAELASQAGNDDIMGRRLAAFDMMNSALRMGVLDVKDKITTRGGHSLSGLEKVLETQAHFVAAAVNIPISVLLDMSPGSLNATGDMNVRNWYASVENDREYHYKPRFEQVVKLLILSSAGPLGGQEPPMWSVKFRPLWSPSELETAQTRKLNSESDKNYFDMSVASSDDIAKSRFGGDTYGTEISIDWAARKKQQALEAQQAAKLDQASLAAMGHAPDAGGAAAVATLEPPPKPAAPAVSAKSGQRSDEDGPGVATTFAGLPIVVENAKGTKREWIAEDGTSGSTLMKYDYGYIQGATGADGDSVDVYLGPDENAGWVYVVHQRDNADFTTYDEDKVMLGFSSPNEARAAYIAQYDDPRFFGGMSMLPIGEFLAKLGDCAGEKITNAGEPEA